MGEQLRRYHLEAPVPVLSQVGGVGVGDEGGVEAVGGDDAAVEVRWLKGYGGAALVAEEDG
jgi:hypothetical protein